MTPAVSDAPRSPEQQKHLELNRQLDFSYSIPGLARFRVNTYFQRESIGGPSFACEVRRNGGADLNGIEGIACSVADVEDDEYARCDA